MRLRSLLPRRLKQLSTPDWMSYYVLAKRWSKGKGGWQPKSWNPSWGKLSRFSKRMIGGRPSIVLWTSPPSPDHFSQWTTFSKIVIAYEPVWAIGTGKVATSAQVCKLHFFKLEFWRAGVIGTRGSSWYPHIHFQGHLSNGCWADANYLWRERECEKCPRKWWVT